MKTTISKDGVVHLMSPGGSGEYTFCGVEITQGSKDPALSQYGEDTSLADCAGRLPNCKECFDAVNELRAALKGVRFSKRLKSSMGEDY